MDRKLGIFETAETMTDAFAPYNVVGVLGLETGIGVHGLRRALNRAQRRHPLLRARIIDHGEDFFYDLEGVPAIPLEVVPRRDPDHWREVAEAELNRPFDRGTGPLMRCIFLQDKPSTTVCELVVTILHTVIDGASAVNLIHELLETWNADAAGHSVGDSGGLPLQPPVERSFPPPYRGARARLRVTGYLARQLADEVAYRWRARGTRRMPVHDDARCRVLCRDLGGEDLDDLVRATRRRRVTLHSALNAAMLIVVQRRLYGGQAVPLRNFNFAMLRPYLDPPVSDQHLGSFHVILRNTVWVASGQDFWELATRINSGILSANRRGDKFLALLTVAGVMRMILRQRRMRMGSTALAYTGPLRLPSRVGSIRIRSVHALVSNLVLGPEYTAQARLFGGRLWWDQIYLDSDMDETAAAAITDDILELLREVGRNAQ